MVNLFIKALKIEVFLVDEKGVTYKPRGLFLLKRREQFYDWSQITDIHSGEYTKADTNTSHEDDIKHIKYDAISLSLLNGHIVQIRADKFTIHDHTELTEELRRLYWLYRDQYTKALQLRPGQSFRLYYQDTYHYKEDLTYHNQEKKQRRRGGLGASQMLLLPILFLIFYRHFNEGNFSWETFAHFLQDQGSLFLPILAVFLFIFIRSRRRPALQNPAENNPLLIEVTQEGFSYWHIHNHYQHTFLAWDDIETAELKSHASSHSLVLKTKEGTKHSFYLPEWNQKWLTLSKFNDYIQSFLK